MAKALVYNNDVLAGILEKGHPMIIDFLMMKLICRILVCLPSV